jgi:hypothetical protein
MTHLSSIRSFEKLTAGGMTFLDADVVRVLEEVLPARFGGAPTDYQLVEDESEDGQPRVLLLVHPSLGPVGPDEMARTFLATIGSGSPPALAAPRPSGARRFPTAIAFGPSDYLRLLSEEMAIQPFNRLTVEAHRRDELAHGSIFTRGSPPACTGVCHAPRLQARRVLLAYLVERRECAGRQWARRWSATTRAPRARRAAPGSRRAGGGWRMGGDTRSVDRGARRVRG